MRPPLTPTVGDDHETRTRALETLADLVGYHQEMGGVFADGARPDVLRLSSQHRGLFVGDAKHTETPRGVSTALRLRRYFVWLRAQRRSTSPGPAVAALCLPTGDVPQWCDLLQVLARDAGLPEPTAVQHQSLDVDCAVAWIVFAP